MSYLAHHGIKGQKWGVRRFQNKDGTRTAAGRKQEKQNRLKATSKDYASIRESLSDNDLKMLNYSNDEIKYMREHNTLGHDHIEYGRTAHRVIQKDKNGIPVTYVDATWFKAESLLTGKKAASIISIDLATRAGDEYRGKGHAIAAGKKMVKWFDAYGYKDYEYMEWAAKEENVSSQKTAEKLGFKKLDVHDEGWTLYAYEHKAKHTSIGGTMHIEGNALILGDSSYLEHHGIRGQRWGVRRFQNRDGSLTNAGRKRLGYTTKGAAQVVGKAFKAGAKAGGNAVKAGARAGVKAAKAVKAHHEKKEAEKLQKKKDKASKTRLGVMANKDLFTNEEIRKLNERFRLEDEMKMATLQKGVEIAKAVGTIAQNVGTVAKTYEDVTGQSLSPIKRKAAEEKARQEKEDRERRLAREDAEEARKAAKEERDIAIHEQTLRKAIASADTQEFTARKTKADADSTILDLYKKGKDFNGGGDAKTDETGKSWMEKATSGGGNVFERMKYENDPEYRTAKDAHDKKVEWEQHEKERDARIYANEHPEAASNNKDQALRDMINKSNDRTGRGASNNSDDIPFTSKNLRLEKDRYAQRDAFKKAKEMREDAKEKKAKEQDEKAVNQTIDDMMEARRKFNESARSNSNGAFDRETAANYIKGKAKELPGKLNPINAISKKITDKVLKDEEASARKALKDQYKDAARKEGRDEANYLMYNNRVNALQFQGYSERQAKKVADTEAPFSEKRNRKSEYASRMKDIEATHRKNSKEINKASKELTDYYYKLINGPGYDPGTPKREALDRKYAQKRGELERLEKDNNDMLDRETKKAKKILEHSFSIQNGVLFIDESVALEHHGVKGQKWGVRRFQNEDGSLTPKGRKHYEKAIAKIDRMQTHSDARRGRLERQHPFAVTGSAIAAAVAAGLSIAATGGASVAAIAAGSAISAAVSAGVTHVSYSVNEAWEGRGTKRRQKKRKEYEEMLNHDGLIVSDGTLYLEHHGIRGQKWGVRRFQNKDGTRTALGKKREMYGATVSVRGQKSSESVGVTKKQAKGKAAAEILKSRNDLSEKERKKLQKHVDRAEKETAKLEKYKEKKKRSQEENTEEEKVKQWNMMTTGMISPDRYKQNIDTINKNHKREIDYLNKMDERDMANEKAFSRKTVAKGMGFALAATAGLAGITAAATGWAVISGYAAIGGGMVGVISGEMKRGQYRDQRRKEMGIDDPGRGKVKDSVYAKHDAFSIQNGTLFIDAGEPYLEHHGVKGMKWGKHLMAGKGEAVAGGGSGEDDEKLKEMAKKAGMSVAEYKQKFASKISGAASKVGEKISVKDKHLVINGSRSDNASSVSRLAKQYLPFDSQNSAPAHKEKDKRSFKQKAYDALGGKYKSQASEAHKDMVHYKNKADDLARRANTQSRAAKNAKKKGAVQDYIANKEGARELETEAKGNRLAQWESTRKANSAQWKYDHSIAGLYDKATGKYKKSHKRTAVPSYEKMAGYYYKEGSNNKLYNNGASKAKTAKDQAKAEVWKAADHVINSHDYYNQSYDPSVTAYGLDTAYRKEAVKYGRLAEGSYRRASALGKQAASDGSTSSRPRARKKKHTSGGSGVSVRKPGRKPVARTKRVTKSSTSVKRRKATGTGASVR